MLKEINLKELLVKILLAQYVQERTFLELEKRGAYFGNLLVKNMEIVFDAVGFPEDNSHEYDYRFELGGPRDESKKLIDDNCFASDWLEDYYHELTTDVIAEKSIVVTDEGFDITDASNLHIVSEKLGMYVDWLYEQYDLYKRGEKPWEAYFNEDET